MPRATLFDNMHLELSRPGLTGEARPGLTDGVITCTIVEAVRMKGRGIHKMGRERAED